MRAITLIATVALVAACNPDPDEDGLETADEKAFGTNPREADSDGDGLDDLAEFEAGTDGMSADSDGDGMTDGDEVLYGFDPLDAESDGYAGGWPYQTVEMKDAIEANGRTGRSIEVGKRFPRLWMVDQKGDVVDLYDFAGQGKKVVIDISAQWCPPCQALAEYFEDGQDVLGDSYEMAELVNEGEVYWLTILGENDASEPPTKATVRQWARDYPNDHIPVLADADQETVEYVLSLTGAWPSLVLLNENMKVVEYGAGIDPNVVAGAY